MGEIPSLDGVRVDVVRGGEPVRITHVLDAVEPRVRPDGRAAFPQEGKAGEGRTNRLDGVVVLSCLEFPGRGADAARAGVGDRSRRPGRRADALRGGHERRAHVRRARRPRQRGARGLGARDDALVAEELARPTLDAVPDGVERFELGAADDDLPSVAALMQLSDLGPLYYQYLYGVPVGRAGLPRAVDPAELLDGAVTSGEYHWAGLRNPTIVFQRNALVRALYREHGRRLRFAGLVLMRGYEQTADDKQRAATARRRPRPRSAPTGPS